jgi:DNA-binding transcriptional LysR family regulator
MIVQMDLDLLLVRSFLVLAVEGDHRAAAVRLGITASALSKRMHRLETQLGVAVTTRTAAGVTITAAGRRFRPHAQDLLNRAEHARATARDFSAPDIRGRSDPEGRALRVGFPGGVSPTNYAQVAATEDVLQTLAGVIAGVKVTYRGVPFSRLRDCLAAEQVDVLWTNSPVRHPAVETVPVPMTTDRIGVVGLNHPFADATEVLATEFAAQPTLFSPQAPAEWMAPYWLGDLRSRADAQLVPIDVQHCGTVFGSVGHPRGVLVMGAIDRTHLPPTGRAVTLVGAAPITFHIAFRRSERRTAVRTLVQLLMTQPPTHLA